jgi:hypothetical protein
MTLSKNLSFMLMVLVSALLIAINYYTIQITSAVRAYINGESLYSKGQKDASRNLIIFLTTADTSYSDRFTQDLTIPVGDREARLGLISGASDEYIKTKFIAGNSHPEDVASMICLFRNFKDVSFMHEAIDIWESADDEVATLEKIHVEIRQKTKTFTISPAVRASYLREIDAITLSLTVKERDFSNVLGTAARKINNFLFFGQRNSHPGDYRERMEILGRIV